MISDTHSGLPTHQYGHLNHNTTPQHAISTTHTTLTNLLHIPLFTNQQSVAVTPLPHHPSTSQRPSSTTHTITPTAGLQPPSVHHSYSGLCDAMSVIHTTVLRSHPDASAVHSRSLAYFAAILAVPTASGLRSQCYASIQPSARLRRSDNDAT